jgi:ribosome-binding factor A
MSTEVKRATRVAERLRVELAELVVRGEIRDPRAQGIIISEVRVTDDLQHARVYLRLTDPNADEPRRTKAVSAMNRASGFLRKEMGSRLALRRTPALKFFWDDQIDTAARLEELLRDGQERPQGD